MHSENPEIPANEKQDELNKRDKKALKKQQALEAKEKTKEVKVAKTPVKQAKKSALKTDLKLKKEQEQNAKET